jgi:hypothetical protein
VLEQFVTACATFLCAIDLGTPLCADAHLCAIDYALCCNILYHNVVQPHITRYCTTISIQVRFDRLVIYLGFETPTLYHTCTRASHD